MDKTEEWISPAECAARLNVTKTTLAAWRHRGLGPAYAKVGGRVQYEWTRVEGWRREQIRESVTAP